MDLNDCEIETNEMNHQNMNSTNEVLMLEKLEDFLANVSNLLNYLTETTKCYQEKYRLMNVINCNEFRFINNAVFYS